VALIGGRQGHKCRGTGSLAVCRAISTVIILAGLGSACSAPEPAGFPRFSQSESSRRPNVLVILVDALRRDHLGVYGYPLPTSPEIDAFAAESFRFTHAYSHSTWTKPSVASLFTSLYPEQHGLGRVGIEDQAGFRTDVLPKRLATLAERLKKAGYETAAFTTNVHIQRKTGFAQGFKRFFSRRLVDAFDLNSMLEEWLAERDQHVPFFAYLHYMDVHWPYDRVLNGDTGRFGETDYEPRPPEHWTGVPAWASLHLNERSLAAIVAGYDQEIAFTDAAFGDLMRWVEERQLTRETIIVLVADHGEGFNEHGELQHGFAPYEEVTAVPLLIRLPKVFAAEPRVVDDPVGLVDVMPTILDLVDLESPPEAVGRSLVPLLQGQPLRERPVYVEGVGVRGMRSGAYSVLVDSRGEIRCFDKSADPGELVALAGPVPEECRRLAEMLSVLERQFDELRPGDDATATVALDDEEIEALRALGYLH